MTFLPTAARRLSEMCVLGERITAGGLLVAAQACDARGHQLGAGSRRVHDQVRAVAPVLEPNGVIPAIDPVEQQVRAGAFAALAG
jgi:histidine ammonia-lyase